jgi:alpha-D-xyloside xylohydrolase
VVEGPGWRRERHGVLSLPLLVRPNSLLAWGATGDRPDYDYANGPTLALYALDDGAGATAAIPTLAGQVAATFTARREGQTITVEPGGRAAVWSLRLVGVEALAGAGRGRVEPAEGGVVVRPADNGSAVEVRLQAEP